MKNIFGFIKKHSYLLLLTVFVVGHFFVAVRMNIFKYNNFDFGKFDLGNMAQMEWNTLHGRTLYLTDYFGTNLPRWAMSHVDPILLLFVPLFAVFPHPLTLVFAQIFLIVTSAYVIYLIACIELKSKLSALLVSVAFLFYPALGYLNAITGFHGVSAVIPFFLIAFYLFEKMSRDLAYTPKRLIAFWVALILLMAGKEQLSLYVVFFGIYIFLFRNPSLAPIKFSKAYLTNLWRAKVVKLAFAMMVVGSVWFVTAFFIIIPAYSTYRISGYAKFAKSLDLIDTDTRDVSLPNYFLSRYDAFGDSYQGILINMLFNNQKVIKVIFTGDKLTNLNNTFMPVMYLPLASPGILFIALPDFLINYLTSVTGIGTAEIQNHRISMIIPVLFVSSIYAISFISYLLTALKNRSKLAKIAVPFTVILSASLLISNVYTSFSLGNPIYLWFSQATLKRFIALTPIAYASARTDTKTASDNTLKIGDVVKLSDLDSKDLDCATKIVRSIPPSASVSGPDYLGAHLAQRETYAIFPALYKDADYVIVDVFSRKIAAILNINLDIISKVVSDLIKNPDYELTSGCGNLFVFQKVGTHTKSDILPLQERFTYQTKMSYEIYQSLAVVDYTLPKEVIRGKSVDAQIVYTKLSATSLDSYVLFMTYINIDTGELYQAANLPSFSISKPATWGTNRYYVEDIKIAPPVYLDAGKYRAFVGMTNNIRSRSIYLGDIEIK